MSSTCKKRQIEVCVGPRCSANFSQYILERLTNEYKKLSAPLQERIEIQTCNCQGKCKQGPIVKVNKTQILTHADPIKASKLI